MKDIFVAPKHHESHMNILSSFCQNPENVSFQTQKEKETIILFLRSHLITNLPWILISLVLIILPPIILALLSNFGFGFPSIPSASRFALVFALFYYFLVFSYVFISFLHWFYNVFIVTSERIVDIDYSDIVVHNMAETKLNHIEDVRYTQSGFIASSFNYGNLFVQTAGTEENFEAFFVPKPAEATDIITQLTGLK